MAGSVPKGSAKWNSGLYDCSQDNGSCFMSCCCPCVIIGQLVEIIDQGATTCMHAGAISCLLMTVTGGCGCFYTYSYRTRLRSKYGLPAEPWGDFKVDCCCLPCSLAQQYRELVSRGVQPDLGWAANKSAYEQSAPQQQKMSQPD